MTQVMHPHPGQAGTRPHPLPILLQPRVVADAGCSRQHVVTTAGQLGEQFHGRRGQGHHLRARLAVALRSKSTQSQRSAKISDLRHQQKPNRGRGYRTYGLHRDAVRRGRDLTRRPSPSCYVRALIVRLGSLTASSAER